MLQIKYGLEVNLDCAEFKNKNFTEFHLTGKPTQLMEQLVSMVPEGHIILDPFVGSGTTLVAAKNMKRQFIGIEKDTGYAEIALKRITE